MDALWMVTGLSVGLLGLLAWKEVSHARLVRDLTAKLMARNLYEYSTVAENKPEQKPKEKKQKLKDPVLGDDF